MLFYSSFFYANLRTILAWNHAVPAVRALRQGDYQALTARLPPSSFPSSCSMAANPQQHRLSPANPPERTDRNARSFPRWTFLTNHAHVLALLEREPDIVLREVALQVGITERAVQRIVQDLEEAQVIERERIGRRNRYRVHHDRALRHPIESHRTIGQLLRLVADPVDDTRGGAPDTSKNRDVPN